MITCVMSILVPLTGAVKKSNSKHLLEPLAHYNEYMVYSILEYIDATKRIYLPSNPPTVVDLQTSVVDDVLSDSGN